MRLALLLSVLYRIHADVFPMTLTSIQYPSPGGSNVVTDDAITRVPLRGPPGRHGDVWGPAIPGTNILPCGSLGNKDTYDRMEVEKGVPFNVMGRIWSTLDGEGTITLSIKYGSHPDFRATSGMLLLEYSPELAQTPLDWVVTTEIPGPAFSDNATIQVEYVTGIRPENWTEPFLTSGEIIIRPWSSVYQCIDLTVKGAKPRPEGAGDSYDPNDFVSPTPVGQRGVTTTNPDGSSTLSPLYIGLIVAAVVIALCLILLLVCCLCRKKKPPPETLEDNAENIKAKPVPPPSSPPEGPHVRLHFEEAEQPPPTPDTIATDPVETLPKDGSFGRLFHFKYVEGDDEHGEEDLLRKQQQQQTLERPRTLDREFDQTTRE